MLTGAGNVAYERQSRRVYGTRGPYETVRWSARYQGLLFGYFDAPNWCSSDELDFPTRWSARNALAFYESRYGLMVLGSHVDPKPPTGKSVLQ